MAEQRTVNPLVVGSSPTRGAGGAAPRRADVRSRRLLRLAPALFCGALAAPGAADTPLSAPREKTAQDDPDAEPVVDFHLRLRGRFLDEIPDLGDTGIQRLSVWTDSTIGDRFQVRATYDVGETRIHDLWAQLDTGGGFRVRVGRSSPTWLGEFTDAPHSFQMVGSAVGSALTRIREDGLFFFFDRAGFLARLHVVEGGGWDPDENGRRDVLGSVGRVIGRWRFEAGHYEGRDGPDETLVPRRQTGFHTDADFGRGRLFRGAVFRREQDGREHLGGFARFRNRFPSGLWGALEAGTESNRGAPENPGHASYLTVGARYELPWTLTHLAADYRFRFGAVSDQELLLVFQWVFDFRDPTRD